MRFLLTLLLLVSSFAIAQTTPCFSFEENDFVLSGSATIIDDNTVRLTQEVAINRGLFGLKI